MGKMKDATSKLKDSLNESIEGIKNASNEQANSHTYNKMFQTGQSLSTANNPIGSFIKKDRLNILSGDIAFEFNTYKNWAPFSILMEPHNFRNGTTTYVDGTNKLVNEAYYEPGHKECGIQGRRSLFNNMTAVNETNKVRISANAPLLDTPEYSIARKLENDCSIRSLIEATAQGKMGVATYSWADFMYCKYLGKCSNEYLITLRRFPYPPGDHINMIDYNIEKETQQHVNDIGRMVTWMGTPGNEMSNIMKYSVKIPYKKFEAKMQEVDENKSTSNGVLASLMNMGDKHNQDLIASGEGGAGSIAVMNGLLGRFTGGKEILGTPPYTDAEWRRNYDENKSYGPLDVITETHLRLGAESGGGLEFEHEISLRFDYEMRSYDGINGRSAMLDLLANILATCFTTGKFWGGSTKFLGASQSNTYANLPIFMKKSDTQQPGNMAQYSKNIADSFNAIFGGDDTVDQRRNAQQVTYQSEQRRDTNANGNSVGIVTKVKNVFGDISSMIQNAGSALGALLYGGLINKLGRPQVLAVNSLLSDAPTGLWHLTIGNPKAPIMSMGNMIIDKCEIEHKGPLGLDGFPTGLTVNVVLKHGKPRENTAIERMYLQGDYRIYSPMGDQLLKMYWGSPSLAIMTASNAYDENIKAGNMSQDDYVKSKYYMGNFTSQKIAPSKEARRSANLSRYFGSVANLPNYDTYLRNEGMEALFGSTSTKSAQELDGRDERLEGQQQSMATQYQDSKTQSLSNDLASVVNDKRLLEKWESGGFITGDYAMSASEGSSRKVTLTAYLDVGEGDNVITTFDASDPDWYNKAVNFLNTHDGKSEQRSATIERLRQLKERWKSIDEIKQKMDNPQSN